MLENWIINEFECLKLDLNYDVIHYSFHVWKNNKKVQYRKKNLIFPTYITYIYFFQIGRKSLSFYTKYVWKTISKKSF